MATLTQQETLNTSRFALRPVRMSDLTRIEHYASDLRLASSTPRIPHPLPPGVIEGYIERAMQPEREEDVWVIDSGDHDGGEVMGVISLMRLDRNQSEVSYWVAPPFWNTGVASKAVQALVKENPLGNDALFASVFHDNPASAKVLINAGFAYLGDAETFCLARGATVPTWTYSIKLR
ncbi:GNAT family N-acetyltransferase [Sulfitobacter donghicola]|uniref:Acetyltransferase n=1 Tax=Sulfitobacter donghicola DSW-25 = KCTC 12864 = JCM 14565 TaxID=1300350 RepID=A0A073IE08_9RHOB|nr:GNAT family protein [Sulfitobacter donghicola]KEJ88563.1 acetyltransferase [Sulfitobacter donghicola DSW-25 = KCTC 12864 = JCM 14565]KIN69549.1 Acetyltransferase, GNAT family protein [Sulfitobacter donghicola DSW-25 = KCTC 12864 = JCM 14565]